MKEIAATVAEVATTSVPVLITGESGTGKELVARAVHDRSLRQAGPFVEINCAGLPDAVRESELFGHVRGAFTGAINDRPGAFKLAQGGTLFLDEIGDLSAKGQGDLLRVLEDGVYRPVGSPKALRADVRIVAATNRDLNDAANRGKFRSDLLYRLNIVEFRLSPLRERREDIPALVHSFNMHFSARHRRNHKTFTPEFMARLAQHPWPGNIRQLRNLIERLLVTVRETRIGPESAPPLPPGDASHAESGGDGEILLSVRKGMTIDEVETQLIRATLERVTPRRDEAAKVLGISRRALHYKLKKLGAGKG
jgi:DNA-binding NtrC family response regulator